MRIRKLCIRLRPLLLSIFQPVGWIRIPAGWSIAFGLIAVSWIDAKKLDSELTEGLKGLDAETSSPRRVDTAGRDVTDLPGLWSEDDVFIVQIKHD